MVAELISMEVARLANEDEEIRRAENNVSFRQIQEILWGSANKQGLAYIVAEQAKASESLSGQIQKIASVVDKLVNDVNGADGVRPDIKELKKDVMRIPQLELRIEKIEQGKFPSAEMDQLKIKADRDHEAIRAEGRDGRMAVIQQVSDNRVEYKAEIDALRKEFRESRKDTVGWIVGFAGIAIAAADLIYKFTGGHAP